MTIDIVTSLTGAPCECGWDNPIPYECLRDDWQYDVCGGTGCNRQFEYRAWREPTEDDREGFVIQSRWISVPDERAHDIARRLSAAQRLLLIRLQPFPLGGPRRFRYHVEARGRALQSCWALKRRDIVVRTDDPFIPHATRELQTTGFVTLTPLGIDVRNAMLAL